MRLLFTLWIAYLVFSVTPSFGESEKERPVFGQIEIHIRAPDAKVSAPMTVKMDPEVCGKTKESESLRLGAKQELADAVAWVEGPQVLAWPALADDDAPSSDSPTFESKNCEISPRVVIAQPRETIRFFNRDPILHSIRAEGKKNYPIFRAHPPQLAVTTLRLELPEIVPITSDLHPWMKAFVVVAPHQNYAISNTDGKALITQIPKGSYQLRLWHSVLGEFKYPSEILVGSKKINLAIEWKN